MYRGNSMTATGIKNKNSQNQKTQQKGKKMSKKEKEKKMKEKERQRCVAGSWSNQHQACLPPRQSLGTSNLPGPPRWQHRRDLHTHPEGKPLQPALRVLRPSCSPLDELCGPTMKQAELAGAQSSPLVFPISHCLESTASEWGESLLPDSTLEFTQG